MLEKYVIYGINLLSNGALGYLFLLVLMNRLFISYIIKGADGGILEVFFERKK